MIANRPWDNSRTHLYASTTSTFDGDLDLIAIEYALNGEPVKLTLAEKIRAAQLLDEHGFDAATIGRRLRSDRSTVSAWKANGWKAGGTKPAPRVYSLPEPPKCGERRMYHRHLRNKEKPCDACRAANAAADRKYRNTGSGV